MARRKEFKTELVNIADFRPHPRNYVEHPPDQIDHIIQSIRQHGFYRNIIVAKDNIILAGHGVVLAARKMGIKKVPVVRLPIKSDSPAALKVLTGDNELRHLAAIDDRALADLLKEIKDDDTVGLAGTGYDEMMLANLLVMTRPEAEIADLDAAAEWVGMPEWEVAPDVFKVVINTKSEKDRDKLLRVLGIDVIHRKFGRLWSTWYPNKEKGDLRSLKFAEPESKKK